MKKLIAILSVLSIAIEVIAQDDVALRVKKMPSLRISPDSMYFDSHTVRKFTIHDIPSGCKLKVEFTGGDLTIGDSSITLIPYYVYRDSDVAKLSSKNLNGHKSTKDLFYISDLIVSATDTKCTVRARLTKTCYIKPEKKPRNVPLSSSTFDPPAMKVLQQFWGDTTNINVPAR
jgi:hypothetical protein